MNRVLIGIFTFSLLCFITACWGVDSYTPATIPQITINQGESFSQTWQIKSCDRYNVSGNCVGHKVPVDITGCTFKASGKRSYADSNAFVNFSTVVFNNHSGVIKMKLSKEQTSKMSKSQTGVFDMFMQWPDGVVVYLMKGTFLTAPTVTH